MLYYIIINFVIDRVAQKARPANVLLHKHTVIGLGLDNKIHNYKTMQTIYKLHTVQG